MSFLTAKKIQAHSQTNAKRRQHIQMDVRNSLHVGRNAQSKCSKNFVSNSEDFEASTQAFVGLHDEGNIWLSFWTDLPMQNGIGPNHQAARFTSGLRTFSGISCQPHGHQTWIYMDFGSIHCWYAKYQQLIWMEGGTVDELLIKYMERVIPILIITAHRLAEWRYSVFGMPSVK